jgi:hypothetical protein
MCKSILKYKLYLGLQLSVETTLFEMLNISYAATVITGTLQCHIQFD